MPSKPYTLIELSPDRRKRKRQLSKIDTRVPLRSEGRTENHTEIYSILWLIRSDRSELLKHPVKVVHTNRPDIQLQTSVAVIGIEITEAVSSNTASMDSLRESEPLLWRKSDDDFSIYHPRRAVPGESKLPAATKRQLIRDNCPGEIWCGTGAEDWATAIAYFAAAKVEKAEGYVQFDRNWLLIYDNWDEPGREVGLADAALNDALHEQAIFRIFDRVLVLDERSLASFSQTAFLRWGRPRYAR